MSACDACQGAMWFPWETWTRNCTAVDPPTTFARSDEGNLGSRLGIPSRRCVYVP
ncbi:hypothetical protein BJV78DRAFT_1244933 [Lactifluus subvellereus]|nr:hypothetical protein BJV78DRAFT_1244933 [Lactifluus subvellereus]